MSQPQSFNVYEGFDFNRDLNPSMYVHGVLEIPQIANFGHSWDIQDEKLFSAMRDDVASMQNTIVRHIIGAGVHHVANTMKAPQIEVPALVDAAVCYIIDSGVHHVTNSTQTDATYDFQGAIERMDEYMESPEFLAYGDHQQQQTSPPLQYYEEPSSEQYDVPQHDFSLPQEQPQQQASLPSSQAYDDHQYGFSLPQEQPQQQFFPTQAHMHGGHQHQEQTPPLKAEKKPVKETPAQKRARTIAIAKHNRAQPGYVEAVDPEAAKVLARHKATDRKYQDRLKALGKQGRAEYKAMGKQERKAVRKAWKKTLN